MINLITTIKELLTKDYCKRISLEEALSHFWISKVSDVKFDNVSNYSKPSKKTVTTFNTKDDSEFNKVSNNFKKFAFKNN